MKLLNRTLLFLSIVLFITVSLWAILFYYQLLRQIKTTLDEGLANYKIVLIDKLQNESNPLQQNALHENNYIIKNVPEEQALRIIDSYKDTLIYSEIKNNTYRTRLLTTAFVSSDGKYYEMKVISQELNRNKLIKKLAISLLWLILFMWVSTILVNNFVLKKTWKPFYQLLKYLNSFRLDKGAIEECTETRIKEFAILNSSVRNLLKTNVNIYNSQKQFIENASHELQTPLAIGINKLELLAGDKYMSAVQIKKIGDIIEAFQRISGINKSLLLLSKIENKQFVSEESIDFDDIFTKILADFTDYAEYQKIHIKYTKENSWVYNMNKNLSEMLVMNLVKNAIIHNKQGGELIITLSSSSFTIENSSNDSPLPVDKLFKRFYKSSKSKNSTGLGLAIVKAIADASGLSVFYSYNKNHVFKVHSNQV